MQMSHEIENSVCKIKLSGEIDHHSIKDIREDIDMIISDKSIRELYIDLENINFMDSSGLGLILGRYKKITEFGGKMYITNPSLRVEGILKMAGVDRLIEIKGGDKNEN